MAKEQNDLITMKEAAGLAGVSANTVATWRRKGLIPSPPGSARVARADVVKLVESRQQEWEASREAAQKLRKAREDAAAARLRAREEAEAARLRALEEAATRRMNRELLDASDDSTDTVTMKEAAELASVSYRTISRWVQLGYLTRKTAPRGQVRLSRKAVVAMNTFEDETACAK